MPRLPPAVVVLCKVILRLLCRNWDNERTSTGLPCQTTNATQDEDSEVGNNQVKLKHKERTPVRHPEKAVSLEASAHGGAIANRRPRNTLLKPPMLADDT